MNVIETKGLSKTYKDKEAVKGLNLTVGDGELFALLGVNGAGKSTTIRMLSCVTEPTSGDAFLCGKSIVTEAEKVKSIINVSPQETAVAEKLTVTENLLLTAQLYGAKRADAEKKANALIEEFGLAEYKKRRAGVLSGGLKRRLSIAMALISEPKILFLDEPTLGLDVLVRRELWHIIEGLKGRMTVILTTHYLEEAEALSDRIGILVDGTLKEVGTPEELKQKAGTNDFEEAFVRLAGGLTK